MGRPTSYKPVFPPKPPGCAARVQLIPSGEYTRSPAVRGRICLRDVPAVSVKGSIFPLHLSSRYPTRYTLFRDWGTPKSLLLSTCHSRPYPNPSSAWRIAANVLPPSWLSRPGTFSSSRYAGLFAAVSRAIQRTGYLLDRRILHGVQQSKKTGREIRRTAGRSRGCRLERLFGYLHKTTLLLYRTGLHSFGLPFCRSRNGLCR